MKLTALQRALLRIAGEGALYAFRDRQGRLAMVATGATGGPEIRPLGVRLALNAGYVDFGEPRGEGEHGQWHQLVLTDAGAQAIADDLAKKP